ncbi:MAG: hypothetical protein HC820_06320 [Hydrococcus sp. RM1_1_31]|nr:hypothetical protein [Hydrococcus sp. RM1_1_31]
MEIQPRFQGSFASQNDQRLIAAVTILYLLQLLLNYPAAWAFVGIGATFWWLSQLQLSKSVRWTLMAILGLLIVPLLLHVWSQPSNAVLLTRAQEFFVTSFSTGTGGSAEYTTLIDLIFNSIRGVYIILLAVAGFQSWQDFRQQEEMSSFARMIFGSLVGIFGIDVISTFIIPTAGTIS